MGDRLTLCLAGAYVIIAATYTYEQNWPKVLYFVSAFGIVTSVWWMK
jgi:hypothetical protein